jgi:hypothetical protein
MFEVFDLRGVISIRWEVKNDLYSDCGNRNTLKLNDFNNTADYHRFKGLLVLDLSRI